MLSPNDKGNIAEAEIVTAATRLGIGVLRPTAEHGRYDLAFEVGDRLVRIQCKWARLEGEVVIVNLAGYRYTARGQVRSKYAEHEIDAVVAYCDALDRCYLLPVEMVAGRTALQLRLAPPKNMQRACLNWAADYELPGAIAQLGERLRGMQEVAGSSPASSTDSTGTVLGANEFRERFGWYLERASAGETFQVNRFGKPYARLSPPHDQLDLAEPTAAADVVSINRAKEPA